MDHVAIMKKEWGLLEKIRLGEKTVESRWYKHRAVPWDKVHKGDTLYFKNTGEPIALKATVTKVEQFEIETPQQALQLIQQFAPMGLGTTTVPPEIREYSLNKRYVIFVHFDNVQKIEAFDIDKTGFGAQTAWICTLSIEAIVSKKI